MTAETADSSGCDRVCLLEFTTTYYERSDLVMSAIVGDVTCFGGFCTTKYSYFECSVFTQTKIHKIPD